MLTSLAIGVDPLADPLSYGQLVDGLNYRTVTHLDISHAVQVLSHFLSHTCKLHLTAVHRIIPYLRNTFSWGFFFSSTSSMNLYAYANVDLSWLSRYTTVYNWLVCFFGWFPYFLESKSLETVSKSSSEAEYRSMSSVCSEIKWLRGCLMMLVIPSPRQLPYAVITQVPSLLLLIRFFRAN